MSNRLDGTRRPHQVNDAPVGSATGIAPRFGDEPTGHPRAVATTSTPADPLVKRAARGVVAGLAATAVMTATRIGAERAGLVGRRPPHSEIVGRLRAVLGRSPWGDDAERAATIAHYAFGAAAGAIYAACVPRLARPATGAVYASAIWTVSFHQVLPRLGLMPPPRRDDTGRQVVLAVDHVVYGLALDACLEGLERAGPLRKRS
jgi:hypothetical protein